MSCAVPGCDKPVLAKGLCQSHYKQARRGQPLPQYGDKQVGDPSGFGRYGIFERDETLALCHECGQWFHSVAAHIWGAHQMTGAEYRREHGLKRTQPLTSLSYSRNLSEKSRERLGTPGWRKFEAARDPLAASRERDMTTQAPAARSERAARAKIDPIQATPHPCTICGKPITGKRRTCSEDCRIAAKKIGSCTLSRARAISDADAAKLKQIVAEAERAAFIAELQRAGVSSVSIGAELGLSSVQMSERYPRPR